MARSPQPDKYAHSELALQIESDLRGAIQLGVMQAQLLRQVLNGLTKLSGGKREQAEANPPRVRRVKAARRS